ncbi:bifunctional DNA primase/polymerase [Streptomyces syringium]|uniref:bifunctional DNA primase/polymerase n=1 Tax=Streptomyces syringium TaxID=76729 RepID=UPI0034427B42
MPGAGRVCHGFYTATLDPDLIECQRTVGDRGVAVVTGPAELVAVVDIDRHTITPPQQADQLQPGVDLTLAQVAMVKDGGDVLRLFAQARDQPDPSSGFACVIPRRPG